MRVHHMKNWARKYLVKSATLEKINGQNEILRQLLRNFSKSYAENFQDVWVLTRIDSESGFFVEFGAGDGVTISNTFLLETHFGWKGILVEPCRAFHSELKLNRNCELDFRAVWHTGNLKLEFNEKKDPYLSGIKSDRYINPLQISEDSYIVETVTLVDLLREHGAPSKIDFLSMDTEGGEIKILREFIMEGSFVVKLICIEHSWKDDNSEFISWMASKGYVRVYPELDSRDYWFENRS